MKIGTQAAQPRFFKYAPGEQAYHWQNVRHHQPGGKNRHLKARNYVGFVQFGEHLLEVQPNIFADRPDLDPAARVRLLMHWLSYGQRTWFPFSEADLDETAVDSFPEALLYVFARQTLHLVVTRPNERYEIVEEALPYFRGRLLPDAYVRHWAQGQPHVLPTEHGSFQYDNLLNRLIKFVTRQLLTLTQLPATAALLRNILFVLDEVVDEPLLTRADCDRIALNRFFGDYARCLDRCRLFLSDTTHQAGADPLHSCVSHCRWSGCSRISWPHLSGKIIVAPGRSPFPAPIFWRKTRQTIRCFKSETTFCSPPEMRSG